MAQLSHRSGRLMLAAAVLVPVVLVLVSGCGPDYKARGAVKGRVTVNKKPLTSGTIMFYGANGITASGSIDTEGNYVIADAPVGDCQVTVTVPNTMDPSVRARLKGKGPAMPELKGPPDAASPALPSAPAVPKEIVPIDAKYSKTETSGLKFKVEKGGDQTFNIEL